MGNPVRQRRLHIEFGCPQCNGRHVADASISVEPQPFVFGGSGASSAALWSARLRCPVTGEDGEVALRVPVEVGERLVGLTATVLAQGSAQEVRDVDQGPGSPTADGPLAADAPPVADRPPAADRTAADRTPADTAPADRSWLVEELTTVRQNSIATLRTFSTTMLTVSTGGIAVYYTVLEYLDPEGLAPEFRWIALLPPLLLVLAAAAYVWSLRPTLDFPDEAGYADARRSYLLRTQRRVTVATGLLLAATAASTALWGVLLWT